MRASIARFALAGLAALGPAFVAPPAAGTQPAASPAESNAKRVIFVDAGLPAGVYFNGEAWQTIDGALQGEGQTNDLLANRALAAGDFHIRAELRMLKQKGSAASFFLDENHFGFEGARDTLFVSGPMFGGLRLLQPSTAAFDRGDWINFEVVRAGGELRFLIDQEVIVTAEQSGEGFERIGFRPMRSVMQVRHFEVVGETVSIDPPMAHGYSIPIIDLALETDRQVIVDREPGQYLGHPTTVLLEDGKTIITVYPKGHGRGAIIMKKSADGGLTWSERLPVPDNWATSQEVPTLYRTIDPRDGHKRLIMFSGLHPIRMAASEDDGETWSPLEPIGEFGGIVAMACLAQLTNGDYVTMFHDDGRFLKENGEWTGVFSLYQTISSDGGLTWSEPEVIWQESAVHLCEPGIIRSPDGRQLAILLRENSRRRNSHVMFSDDEAKTWSEPRELPAALTGDRHTAVYAPDGRLFISFRDTTLDSPTQGDWVGWVGTYDDIVNAREGEYRVRLMDNHHRWDCSYPGVLLLPDGTIVTTTYGHWTPEEEPYIVSVRFKLEELDAKAAALAEDETE